MALEVLFRVVLTCLGNERKCHISTKYVDFLFNFCDCCKELNVGKPFQVVFLRICFIMLSSLYTLKAISPLSCTCNSSRQFSRENAHKQTDRKTDAHTGPIMLPLPLMREVIMKPMSGVVHPIILPFSMSPA